MLQIEYPALVGAGWEGGGMSVSTMTGRWTLSRVTSSRNTQVGFRPLRTCADYQHDARIHCWRTHGNVEPPHKWALRSEARRRGEHDSILDCKANSALVLQRAVHEEAHARDACGGVERADVERVPRGAVAVAAGGGDARGDQRNVVLPACVVVPEHLHRVAVIRSHVPELQRVGIR